MTDDIMSDDVIACYVIVKIGEVSTYAPLDGCIERKMNDYILEGAGMNHFNSQKPISYLFHYEGEYVAKPRF